ncbi:hypothetical protein GA512_10310 [Bacillus paralicheniformis]|nr:hypothetical protein [Bacillus paralicheniformis]
MEKDDDETGFGGCAYKVRKKATEAEQHDNEILRYTRKSSWLIQPVEVSCPSLTDAFRTH